LSISFSVFFRTGLSQCFLFSPRDFRRLGQTFNFTFRAPFVNTFAKTSFFAIAPASKRIRVSDRDRTGDLQGHNLAL